MLSPLQRLATLAALVLVVLGLAVGVYAVLHLPRGEKTDTLALPSTSPGTQPASPPPRLLAGPDEPDLVLLVSGEMHGYLQPCGCARPQLGGLERRFEVLEQLRAKGWPVSAVDLGDLAPPETTEQGRIKFETALQTLHKMNYAAVGLGLMELALSLDQALGIAINYQPPAVLAANLDDAEGRFPEMFRPWTIDAPKAKNGSSLKVGYVGLVGKEVAEKAVQKDAALKFKPADTVVPAVLRELEPQKPDLLVLLFQGTREEARELIKKHPQFRLVLTLDISDEPSSVPETIGETSLVSLGHKGKYVGLVGVYRKPDTTKLDLRYQLLPLTYHFELPVDQTNLAREEMRNYVLRIHSGNFLARAPKGFHPLQVEQPEARYVGAEACKECHKSAYAVWSTSPHAHAFESLVKKGQPTATRERKGQPPLLVGRHSDPDCVRCHSTGFEYRTGFVDESTTPHLKGNQCENCHGPASLHVAHPKEEKYWKPLHLTIGKQVEFNICRRCHDGDNDPKFNLDLYWPKVRHGKD